MKIHKMPKNYMICNCGCEFEFGVNDIEYSQWATINLKTLAATYPPYVKCPSCEKKLDIDKAREKSLELSGIKLDAKLERKLKPLDNR